MMKNFSLEYGIALFKLAQESGAEKEIFDDFDSVSRVFAAQPQLERLLSNPRLSADERANVMGSIFGGKVNLYLLNMLKILAEKRRCDMIEKCWQVYKSRYCEANNIMQATVYSAAELSDEQRSRLIETLSKKTGSDIILDSRIDKSCIGGMRIEYDGKRFDSSVKQKLSSFKKSLKSGY